MSMFIISSRCVDPPRRRPHGVVRMRKTPTLRSHGRPHGRREQNRLDKRARIQRAGWELFTTVGYDETTTREVAERADVAVGTLFLYAEDKRDLLCLVMHDE